MAGGRKPKQKGNRYERELVNQAKDSGLDAKRAYASNGQSLGHHEEVDIVICGKKIQCKRKKAIPSWIGLSEHVDASSVRCDGGESYVVMRWFDYLDLLKEIDNEQTGKA